jgi:predicted TIM-barrel fold metal-dependent hydrolase
MKNKRYKKWDLHHHIVPDFYVTAMKEMALSVAGIKWPKWDARSSIKMMNQFNIEKAFVSISTPGIFFKDASFSQNLARQCNDYIFSMTQEYPDRFGGFASVPLPDVPRAVEEAVHALDYLRLDGISLMSNVDGHYLGDTSFEPFFDEMNKRKAIIYVHPNEVPGKEDHLFLNPLYLWQNDTTKAIISFINSGYHKQFPNIRWLFSHGGGIIAPLFPALIESLKATNPNIVDELNIWKKNVFLDTASKAFDDQVPYLLGFSDTQHLLFGSDIGWGNKMAVSEVEKAYSSLSDKYGLTEKQIEGIFINNAKRLFSMDSVPVVNEFRQIYDKPAFGNQEQNIQYHCHSIDDALNLIASKQYEKVYLSLDDLTIWTLGTNERHKALQDFNDQLAKLCLDHPHKISGFCAIDTDSPEWSITEIDRVLNTLHLDGICLTVDSSKSTLYDMYDEALMQKIASAKVPVLIHPKYNEGIPLITENNLDSLYFIAKAFYLDIYKKYWSDTQFILTHTSDCLQYLSQPIGLLYYLAPKISTLSMFAYLWDAYIIHKPKGYMILKNIKTS